jgi:hypothetical protein
MDQIQGLVTGPEQERPTPDSLYFLRRSPCCGNPMEMPNLNVSRFASDTFGKSEMLPSG